LLKDLKSIVTPYFIISMLVSSHLATPVTLVLTKSWDNDASKKCCNWSQALDICYLVVGISYWRWCILNTWLPGYM